MKKTRGFLIVASRSEFYYFSAINLMQSLREFYPDAKVCLVTEERFLDQGGRQLADDIIFCDDHIRAKLWGMAMSPYDHTMYIDADMEVQHEDIKTIWDKFDGNDILFTALDQERSYIFAEYGWGTKGEKFEWCGATCLYDMSKPHVKKFMMDWYNLTVEQYAHRWWPTNEEGKPDYENYPETLKRWDQFSLWWLLNREEEWKDLKVGRLDGEDDARWNHFIWYRYDHCNGKPSILYHYSNVAVKNEMRDKY